MVDHLRREQVEAGAADVFGRGGEGAMEIAQRILGRARAATPRPCYIYELTDPPMEKVRRIARAIYGAEDVDFSVMAKKQLDRAEALGLGELPICIAKTHLSLSDDERLIGRPRSFDMTVREVRIAAGAGFLVPLERLRRCRACRRGPMPSTLTSCPTAPSSGCNEGRRTGGANHREVGRRYKVDGSRASS